MRRAALLAFLLLSIPSFVKAEDIKIGVAGPMTGGLAAFGEQIQHGAQIAIEEINAKGGLLGQKLKLIAEDDACDPKQAHDVASKMVSQKVAVVFGHRCSAGSMAASSVYGEDNILQIDVGGLLKKFTLQGFPNLLRVSTNSTYFSKVIVDYVVKNNPKAKVAIITDQPAVTKELADELQKFFAKTDSKIVSVEQIRGGDKDFSSVIDHLKTVQPDVIVCSCYTVEAGLLARQMADKKLDVYFYGWDTFNSPDFLAIIANTKTDKIVAIDYARPASSPELERVTAKIREHNWPAETTTFMTYTAFQVFKASVEKAGSFDTTKVVKAMHEGQFDTILGRVSFDTNGDRLAPQFATYQWVDGKLKMTGVLAN